MFAMVLSVMVMTSSGGLLSERTPTAGMLMGATQYTPVETMSVTELTVERARLLDTMPSMGVGITLTVVGGAVLLTGLVIVSATLIIGVIVVGLVVMAASVPLLIIGPILLVGAGRERRGVQTQVRLIDQRLSQLKRDEYAPPPLPPNNNEVPPPPPVRPPGVELAPTLPQLLLATF